MTKKNHKEKAQKKTPWWAWVFITIIVILVLSESGFFDDAEQSTNLDNSINQEDKTSEQTEAIPKKYCGDGTCDYNEDCSSCSSDCGICDDEILDNIKETIVWVKYEVTGKDEYGSYFETGGTGTGVIYYNDNKTLEIYTNRHVIDCGYNDECFQRLSEKISVRTQDGKWHDVINVSFAGHEIDIAVLKIKPLNAPKYKAVDYYVPDVEEGGFVYAVGYPSYADRVVEFSVSEGYITNIKDLLMEDGYAFNAVESDAYTYFGSSGGGLFNVYGDIVGITTWADVNSEESESIAITLDSLEQLDDFFYCEKGFYHDIDGYCTEYCEADQVLGADSICYDVCEDFYCETEPYEIIDENCEDEGYILGEDGYCHLPCGSDFTYCGDLDAYCYMDNCIFCEDTNMFLFKDGICRYYE